MLEFQPDFDFPAGVANTTEFAFAANQGRPGAYVAEAREGAYLVMKLDADSLLYKQSNNTYQYATTAAGGFVPTDAALLPATLTQAPISAYVPAACCMRTNGSGYVSGTAGHILSSSNMGLTIFKGLSSAATITVTTRIGFEATVPSSSALVPNVEKACPYDPVAINAYWAISKELMSAYPASYNFLGALWNVVKNVGKAVLPHLGSIGRVIGDVAGLNPPEAEAPREPFRGNPRPVQNRTIIPQPSVVSGRTRAPKQQSSRRVKVKNPARRIRVSGKRRM